MFRLDSLAGFGSPALSGANQVRIAVFAAFYWSTEETSSIISLDLKGRCLGLDWHVKIPNSNYSGIQDDQFAIDVGINSRLSDCDLGNKHPGDLRQVDDVTYLRR